MKRYCSFILVVVLIFSLAVSASAANGMETGRIGTQTAAERVYAEQKADAVERMMEIREAYFGNNRTISAEDRSELEALLGRYYPDSSIEKFLSFVNASTRANPGDYDSLNLHLPGEIQETTYYCGPASGYAVLAGRGISVTQSELAQKMGTTTDGTGFYNVSGALNQYNGVGGNRFYYSTMPGYVLTGESMTATEWAIKFTNAAITTLLGGYGVIYNIHQYAGNSSFLTGYDEDGDGLGDNRMWHFVAGEGFNSSDPSNRVCYYYDSNIKDNLGDHHMSISFRVMAILCNDRGLIY
jgi:hypothetical protein